jgi:hypothetical protein
MLFVIDVGSPKDPYDVCKLAPGIKPFPMLLLSSLVDGEVERNFRLAADADGRANLA